jgi:hypothetical protein
MDFSTPAEVKALIEAAGGPTELARRMGFDKQSGRQRVANWRMNGRIPPMVVMAYEALFKKIMRRVEKAAEQEEEQSR